MRFQIITSKWTLTVPRIISQHDEGNYTCVVSNVHGLLQHTVFVDIIGISILCSRSALNSDAMYRSAYFVKKALNKKELGMLGDSVA